MNRIQSNECGYVYDKAIYGDTCPLCGNVEEVVSQNCKGKMSWPKKYHFRYYYRRYRICKKCEEYVPSADVCPARGHTEMIIKIADKYRYSNLRCCSKCHYESYAFYTCPKCGTEMELASPNLLGDFCSLNDFYPLVEECSEDEEILDVSESYLYFNAFSNITQKITITCNYCDWRVQKCPKWIEITRKEDDDTLYISILPNMSTEDRTTIIEIECGGKKKEITIVQYSLSVRQIRSFKDIFIYLNHLLCNR